jgi:uncharacterized protein (TIGR03435 family)
MRHFLRLIVALLALVLSSGALFAQGLAGTWQGKLQPPGAPQALRVVLMITNAGGTMTGFFYPNIDQSGQRLPLGPISLQGSALKLTVPGGGITFDGKLDGNAITGNFSQGQALIPVSFERATTETAWVIPNPPVALKPMAADANPAFDVVSIKPSKPDTPGQAITMNGRNFATLNMTVSGLIAFAYGVQAKQLVGMPDWATQVKYDIAAKPDGDGMPNDRQIKGMIQKMLADRFKFTFHNDKRELAVYALVVARGGHKLTRSENQNTLPALFFRGLGNFPVRSATMREFAQTMQNTVLDRPVVDQTGLTERFDFTLTWTPDQFQFNGAAARLPPPPDNAPPDLFTAIQEQLGLRLESTKAQADVMVVDRIEKATED